MRNPLPSLLFALLLLALTLTSCQKKTGAPVEMPGYFPTSAQLPGWEVRRGPATYDRESLYRYIDGEADLYLQYGFTSLKAVKGVLRGAGEISIDVYELGSLLDAFGVFGKQRKMGERLAGIGAGAFAGDELVAFYKSRYYVKISVDSAQTDAGRAGEALRHLAGIIAARLPGGNEPPSELALLPPGGLDRDSALYFPGNLLGYDFLGRGITGEYSEGGRKATLFLSLFESDGGAKKALEEYGKFLDERAGTRGSRKSTDGDAISAADPYHGSVSAVRRRSLVIGAASAAGDELFARKLLESALRHLEKRIPPE